MSKNTLENQINELWESYNSILLGYFINKTGCVEDAKDLMAQAFAKYFISQYQSNQLVSNPKAFLWKIADNLLKDFYKSKSTTKFDLLHRTSSIDKADTQITFKNKEIDIHSIILCIKKSLTAEEFELLNQVYVDELKYKNIESNYKTSTLRQKVARSIQKARQICEARLKELFA
jgi:DNA-directed RNA polymerase specialized sigma24 family protein